MESVFSLSVFDDSAIFTMSPAQFVLLISACSVASLLIGAVSLGGVIFLPTLIAAGVNPKVGIVTSFVATTPMSIYRVVLMSRIPGAIPWKQSIVASCGIAVGAVQGTALIRVAPQKALSIGIGVLSLVAGARDLADLLLSRMRKRAGKGDGRQAGEDGGDDADRDNGSLLSDTEKQQYHQDDDQAPLLLSLPPRSTPTSTPTPAPISKGKSTPDDGASSFFQSPRSLFGLGVVCSVVGVGSALTGTGGPMILFPILLFWKPSINRQLLIGMTTPMALVMVALTGATSMASGLEPDFGLVVLLCVISLVGASYGVKLLTILTQEQLQGIMSVLLLGVAIVMLL